MSLRCQFDVLRNRVYIVVFMGTADNVNYIPNPLGRVMCFFFVSPFTPTLFLMHAHSCVDTCLHESGGQLSGVGAFFSHGPQEPTCEA